MQKAMFENAHKMCNDLEKQGAKVAVACVGISTITVKALYGGVWFEYGWAANVLSVTCNGQIIEEMEYKF